MLNHPTSRLIKLLHLVFLAGLWVACSAVWAQGWAQGKEAPPPPASAAASVASSASAPAASVRTGVPQLRVDAPGELRKLLSEYLDVSRALNLPEAANLDSAEWGRLLGAAPAQARELARTLGFFNAEARMEAEQALPDEPDALRHGRFRLKVLPGEAARVESFSLDLVGKAGLKADSTTSADAGPGAASSTGPAELTTESNQREAKELQDALRHEWALAPGSVFRNDAWTEAKAAVIARLRAAGYRAATWRSTSAEVHGSQNTVVLRLLVDSGPLFQAGDIQVEGLRLHTADQVTGLAGFSAGAALTENRLQDYQERLQKTGLFDQVTVSLDPQPASAQAVSVLVRVREAPLHALALGLGTSANNGARVSLEHVWRRVGGWPASLRSKLLFSRNKNTLEAELSTHPDAQFDRDLLGVNASQTLSGSDLIIAQRLRLGRSHETLSRDRLNFLELEHSRECTRVAGVDTDCADLQAFSINSHVNWRRLDHLLLPTRGYSLQLQLGAGISDNGALKSGLFGRAWSRLTGYWPVGDGWFSQARVELGRVAARQELSIPDSQLFRAGGDDSVRGYAWRSLSPTGSDGTVSGGRLLFTTSAEIARPVSVDLPSVWWAAFIDGGRAANQFRELQPAWGYGLGLRWRSPVGPLQLDWAWGQEDHRGRLHLNVGLSF